MKRGAIAGAATAMLFVFAGAASCDKATEPFKDSPRSGFNNDPANVGSMPDGFNNWSAKCDGPNMVYTVFHSDSSYGSVAVAPNDPRCTGKTTP
jgi:hypothetical protein